MIWIVYACVHKERHTDGDGDVYSFLQAEMFAFWHLICHNSCKFILSEKIIHVEVPLYSSLFVTYSGRTPRNQSYILSHEKGVNTLEGIRQVLLQHSVDI